MHMCFMVCFKRDSIVDEIHWESRRGSRQSSSSLLILSSSRSILAGR